MKQNILIVAGEASGDLHAAALIRVLNQKHPDLTFTGIGGDKMKAEGVCLLYHISDFAFLGLIEVVKHLPFIRKVKRDILNYAENESIKTVILVDYPGFNLSIAKELHKKGVKIIYYISPQVWAWGRGRIKTIRKIVDKMLVVFTFEEAMYKMHGVDAVFVGHPLTERVKEYPYLSREEFCARHGLDPDRQILLLLPGSRQQEVSMIFPDAIQGAGMIARKHNMQIVVALAQTINRDAFLVKTDTVPFTVVEDDTYNCMKHASFGIIKSGTSTIEAALLGLPMVVVYKTNSLTFAIGKRLVKIRNIGMVNIIAGKTIVPELLQGDAKAEKIFEASDQILSSEKKYSEMKNALTEAGSVLGTKPASDIAAEEILKVLNR